MQEFVVKDQFGNIIAQGFYDRTVAETFAKGIPNTYVVEK
jgi:hypothetical protein